MAHSINCKGLYVVGIDKPRMLLCYHTTRTLTMLLHGNTAWLAWHLESRMVLPVRFQCTLDDDVPSHQRVKALAMYSSFKRRVGLFRRFITEENCSKGYDLVCLL